MAIAADVRAALDAIAGGVAAHDLESDELDFKRVGRSRDDTLTDLAEAAACFANAGGGSVVVGVRDKPGGLDAFLGVDLDVAEVRQRVFEWTTPGLTVAVDEIQAHGARLIVLTVPEGATLHAVGGKHAERVGASCQPLSAERIARVMAERRGEDWSAGPSDHRVDDVDPLALSTAREFLGASPDPARRSYARLPEADLLRTLGVLEQGGRLNRAGAVLFVVDALDRDLLSYSHRRTPTGALTANEVFRAPLVTALARVFDLISARVEQTSVNVGRGVQIHVAELPENAVREAVVNAVMHRDYRDTARVVVEHAATRLAVTSPGPFVRGVTPQNVLTTASRSRNPRLAEAIRKLGLAETAGTGVDRMYAAMASVGHELPRFESDESTVRVVLVGGAPNEYLARYVARLPREASEDADTMVVLLRLLTQRTVDAAGLANLLQRPEIEVKAALDRMAAAPLSIIEPTRQTRSYSMPSFRLQESAAAILGPAVHYRARRLDSAETKIIDLLRESGQINAKMVKILLETDPPTTSRLLRDLSRRGWIVKTSAASRGPAVTYGPGPEFPAGARAPRSVRREVDQPDLFE